MPLTMHGAVGRVSKLFTVLVCSEGIHPILSQFLFFDKKILAGGGSYGLNNVRWQQQQINLFSHGNFRSIDTIHDSDSVGVWWQFRWPFSLILCRGVPRECAFLVVK